MAVLFTGCRSGDQSVQSLLPPSFDTAYPDSTRRSLTPPTLPITKSSDRNGVALGSADNMVSPATVSQSDSSAVGLVTFVQDAENSSRRPAPDDLTDLQKEVTLETELPDAEPSDANQLSDQTESTDPSEPAKVEQPELEPEQPIAPPLRSAQSRPGPVDPGNPLPVDAVLQSTLDFYPEIEVVMEELRIANGNQIQAAGNFDTKLKIASENTPVGFYETYRSKFELEQPTFNGGSLFAGYRFGRGDIEPWYLERNTNAGGELKLGANWALLRDRDIDARRVALWQSNIQRNAVEPMVHQQLLQVFRDAEIAYWNWAASGQIYQRSFQLFNVARDRVEGIEERIKAGDAADITRTDNERSILSREVKLIKAKAKLDAAAIKMSLYYRNYDGTPLVADESQLPKLVSLAYDVEPSPEPLVSEAICCRPETKLIAFDLRSIDLDLAKARNDLLPSLNAQVAVSQDFGRPTSASAAASSRSQTLFVNFDEKDEFQVDAGVFLSQSLQRRKALGKIRSLSGKRRQLQIKRQFIEQKITAEVQQNHQLTVASQEQIRAAEQNYALAQKLSEAARERIATGDVDLFEIILREQQELDAAIELAASQFAFFSNRANLNASIGCARHQAYERLLPGGSIN